VSLFRFWQFETGNTPNRTNWTSATNRSRHLWLVLSRTLFSVSVTISVSLYLHLCKSIWICTLYVSFFATGQCAVFCQSRSHFGGIVDSRLAHRSALIWPESKFKFITKYAPSRYIGSLWEGEGGSRYSHSSS